jgi:hypothetical protein
MRIGAFIGDDNGRAGPGIGFPLDWAAEIEANNGQTARSLGVFLYLEAILKDGVLAENPGSFTQSRRHTS